MAEVEPMKIDGADGRKSTVGGQSQMKKSQKRQRVEPRVCIPSPEEKQSKIVAFRAEVNSLVKFCKEILMEHGCVILENEKAWSSPSLNGVIACLMEESDLPLSKLVDEIFEKVRGRGGNSDGVSKATVKSSVLMIGQRICYGETNIDADILEDETDCAIWCWETRDLKLMPKLARATLKVRRTCRKKIQERIMAVLAMIYRLEKLDNDQNCLHELTKATEKLSKVLNEADIKLLMENMSDKKSAEMAEKEAKRAEKLLLKQMEKSKREMEKERKKVDRELQREKLQNEKEMKRLHDEAEKEMRRREKEEQDMQKKLKNQQEETDKCQRRKERENNEVRNRLALQKQASLMERFLKRNKANTSIQNDSSMHKETASMPSSDNLEIAYGSVTQAMDCILTQHVGMEVDYIWKSHMNTWRCMGHSHSNRKVHWGIRQKPKTELIKELKLTTNKEVNCDDKLNTERLVDGWVDSNTDQRFTETNTDNSHGSTDQQRPQAKQLLQFDKSHRPAFYGFWPKKSFIIGPRHPLVKDPEIDYEIDSDDEWEEEEPGKSLSDCDKDDEDESMEGQIKDDDEDESEDGFFVPDGYLSENEGMKDDEMDCDDFVEAARSKPISEEQVQSEEFCTLFQQQTYLNSLTDHALRKNQPLIVLNLMHEKTSLLVACELTGIEKLERMCLQALSVCPIPGFAVTEIFVPSVVNDDQETSSNKLHSTPLEAAATILDSDLPTIVSTIQSFPHSIGKIVMSLQTHFPSFPKSQLRNEVREISDFSDNRWQVKKEIMSKLGLSISPEKRYGKVKSIATYLKRCLPPSGKSSTMTEASCQSTHKLPSPRVGSHEHP